MRRVLLSSIEGAAVTAVKIEGVLHEFSPIQGVVEDATDIILNLKQIPLKVHTDQPKTLTLRATKPGEVRARDIVADADVEILEPDAHIATVSEGGKLEMELRIKRGRGYVSADKNFDEDLGIGWIPIDSVHSPVKKVNYVVEAARIGQTTDYDKLTLEVWTNGAVTPRDAVSLAAKLIRDHFTIFVGLDEAGDQPLDGGRRHAGVVDQRAPRQERRGARALGAVLQLPEEREHPDDSRARAEDRRRDAEDEELRPQVAQRDQGHPGDDGAEPRHAARSAHGGRATVGRMRSGQELMRHRVAHRKLGRVTEHRIAMLRNQASALIEHERIQTTVARGKELRPFVERIISVAKRSLDAPDGSSHGVTARRAVARDIADREVVHEAVRRRSRRASSSGRAATRACCASAIAAATAPTWRRSSCSAASTIRTRRRARRPTRPTADKPKKKTMGERMREALGGGGKKDETPGGGRVEKKAKGAPKKITTPRKAGGS